MTLAEQTKISAIIEKISALQGDIKGIDTVKVENNNSIRDITVDVIDQQHTDKIIYAIKQMPGVSIEYVSDRVFLFHLGGKIEVISKTAIKNREQLSMAYTPGVARVCMDIHDTPENVHKLTIKRNTVAIVTDGSAVLGLGNIGAEAALPVMEGKAMLFKNFANVDAFPICLATQDTEEIIKTVKNIAPAFGGINLEDIASPRCFEIEDRLKEELDIPVFHDDQHGTAIVMAAGFINALRLTNRQVGDLKVVFSGVGAAGVACTKILQELGVKNIIGCDSKGAISKDRTDLNQVKQNYAETTNPNNESGSLATVLKDADVFIGLSGPNLLSVDDIKTMKKDPIVFAMANPTPEIMPELAAPHVAIMATGRSDYPNQINNVLAFPGLFRGILDCHACDINKEMKLAAAHAIADTIAPNVLSPEYIVPSVFDQKVVEAVAAAVNKAAHETGVCRK
ncbi:MAG: malic enzyme-like NAD(P)-binding protein [Pseudomonadota bacterium]